MMDDRHLYGPEYFLTRAYGKDPRREAMYAQERRRIGERSHFGAILDVGCGTGGFLAGADDRYVRFGVEPSAYASKIAEGCGMTILPDMRFVEDETMDIVTFRGTLQHISTPIQDLFHAARVLRNGGLLAIIATPDADSIVYRTWGRLPALDAPRNWIVFGHRELANILSRLGFVEIEVLHPYWRTPYARPLSDFWNFVKSLIFGWRAFAFPGSMMEIYARKG